MSFVTSIWKDFSAAFLVQDRWKMYFEGLGNTLIIAFLAGLIGITIGVTMAMIKYINRKTGKIKWLSAICSFYITIVRGTPVVLQLMILYFVVFAFWDNGILIGAITFGLNSGAYVAEIARSGFESVDDGQMEAGRSLGLSSWQTMRRVIIPQAVRNCLPPLFNEFIMLVKETAIVGYVGIYDLGKIPGLIQSRTFDYLFPLLIAAVLYLIVVLILTKILHIIEKALSKSDRNNGSAQTVTTLKQRSLVKSIILSVVTLGIYELIWLWGTVKNTRMLRLRAHTSLIEMVCLLLVPGYSFYWWYTRSGVVCAELEKYGKSAIALPVRTLILSICGLNIVNLALMQADFNTIAKQKQGGDPHAN